MTQYSLLLNISDLFNSLPAYHHHNFDVTNYLTTMASWSSMMGVALVIILLVVLLVLNRYDKDNRWNVSGKFLTTAFTLIWLAGFVIYDVGMYIGHNRLSLLTNMPMAIIHAFEMFLLESDVAAIHDQFHDNWIYMGAFSLVHLLAAINTLVFVIKHFGYHIIAGFRLLFEAYVLGKKQETYVLWGLNDASYQLARSIRQHHGGNSKDYRIIVVRSNHDNNQSSVKNGMERLFNFLSINNTDLERLSSLNCLTTSTYSDLSNLPFKQHAEASSIDILRHHLHLNQMCRIIRQKTTRRLHIFLLSDDDDHNIMAVSNLKMDSSVIMAADRGVHVTLYCKARYNSVHRVIEDEQAPSGIEVKVVDASHISVEILKQNFCFHPVNYVDIQDDATVSSNFNALVVGFGEVGQDAVRFLYEFGAFVKTGSDSDRAERSGFHCHVVDKNIKASAGLFAVNAPSISRQITYDDENQGSPSPFTLHNLDIHSVDFYRLIEQWIATLNYVVLALDDDEENVSLAVRIFRLAVRHQTKMSKLRILARVRDDEGGHLLHITEHYNRLWAAEEHSDDPQHCHQQTIGAGEIIHEPITLFGSTESTFTWDYIVSDQLQHEALLFKKKYDQSIRAMSNQSIVRPDNEHVTAQSADDSDKSYSPTFSSIMRLRRVQRQNMENCFHQQTKRFLAQSALGEDKYGVLSSGHLRRNENETTYQWTGCQPDAAITRVLDVLAQTEHLRWMASHEILGYRDDGTEADKDEARLLHGCLKPWSALSTTVRSYDYNVVDVSLGII